MQQYQFGIIQNPQEENQNAELSPIQQIIKNQGQIEEIFQLQASYFNILCYKKDFFEYLQTPNTIHLKKLIAYCIYPNQIPTQQNQNSSFKKPEQQIKSQNGESSNILQKRNSRIMEEEFPNSEEFQQQSSQKQNIPILLSNSSLYKETNNNNNNDSKNIKMPLQNNNQSQEQQIQQKYSQAERCNFSFIAKQVFIIDGAQCLASYILQNQELLHYIFGFLEQYQIDSTCAAYFSALLASFSEDSAQKQLLDFLDTNKNIQYNIIKHMDNFPICEQIRILLSKCVDPKSYQPRLNLLNKILEFMDRQVHDHDSEWLENVSQIINEMFIENNTREESNRTFDFICRQICDQNTIKLFMHSLTKKEKEQQNISYIAQILTSIVANCNLVQFSYETHNIIIEYLPLIIQILKPDQNIISNNYYYDEKKKIKVQFYGLGRFQMLQFFIELIQQGHQKVLEALSQQKDFYQIIFNTLENKKWNNMVHIRLEKIIEFTFLSNHQGLITNLLYLGQKEKLQNSIIYFLEDFYRKKNIYTNIGPKKIEFQQGNIGPLVKLMLMFDQHSFYSEVTINLKETKANPIVKQFFKESKQWEQFREQKLDKVRDLWQKHEWEDQICDSLIKLEKKWHSYVQTPNSPSKQNSGNFFQSSAALTQSNINRQMFNELPQVIDRDESFVMSDSEDIKEIIMDRALVGCKNPNGCQNMYCRDNKEFRYKGMPCEADIYDLLKDQAFMDAYKPCKKLEEKNK